MRWRAPRGSTRRTVPVVAQRKPSNVLPGKPTLREGALVPAAPPDLVAAMGALDQRIYVVPSKRLVVVRQGRAATDDRGEALSSFDNELWKRLGAALPQ